MVSHRRVIRLKGGSGSGHRGHRGRPGLRGGSAPGIGGARNVVSDWSGVFPHIHDKVFGDITKEQVEDMFTLPGVSLDMKTEVIGMGNAVLVKGIWRAPDGEKVGQFARAFRIDRDGKRYVTNSALVFTSDFQGHGFATSLYNRQIGQLRKAGFDRIELQANISIGRYAWAKKGFDYTDPGRAARATSDFREWASGFPKPAAGWPTFKSAQDVANYKMLGIRLRGDSIANPDVPADMMMDVGKAFMLDMMNGHGSWDAELKL